ncbi:HAD family phosphatase [Nocardioidaceae bacterium]|nr:HAD family phosphatase [Nocardioidaceae bacterium]
MDGTLVDTEPYWMNAEYALVHEHGGTWTHEDAMSCVGNDLLVTGQTLRDRGGVPLQPREIVERLLDAVVAQVETEVPWRPGARELLSGLAVSGTPCALVTMSWERLARPVVGALPEGTFATVVTGDQVQRGKPDPEAYALACARLGVAPEDALAIEDSPTGAASAEAAGCTVLVVPCHVEVPTGERRRFRDSLAGLDVASLAAVRA